MPELAPRSTLLRKKKPEKESLSLKQWYGNSFPKYKIVEYTRKNGEKFFNVKKRFLWFLYFRNGVTSYNDITMVVSTNYYFKTLDSAKEFLDDKFKSDLNHRMQKVCRTKNVYEVK